LKGRTICPKCKKEFVLDLPDENKTHNATCPECKNEFSIKVKCENKGGSKQCSWEEHGEPRKTILSSIKPRSNKPLIAVLLLVCVFSIGLSTAVFSDVFIGTTFNTASAMGLKGNINVYVTDQSNLSLENVNVVLSDKTFESRGNGTYILENATLGLQTIQITKQGYNKQEIELLVTPFFSSDINIKMQQGTTENEIIKFNTLGCLSIVIIFSVFAILAVIACVKRQHFDLAVVGSFLAIFSFGFFLIGSILSIIAFVLIFYSRDEFENGKKGKIF
jgi:hypothetical protein